MPPAYTLQPETPSRKSTTIFPTKKQNTQNTFYFHTTPPKMHSIFLFSTLILSAFTGIPALPTPTPTPQEVGASIIPEFEFPEFPELGHSEFPEIPIAPQCMRMGQTFQDCLDGPGAQAIQNDVEIAYAVKDCLCGSRWFSVEIVTECMEDETAWSDICGDELQDQEVGLGLSVSA
ncbi:hypothetical protein P167DRAFT_604960 [Morchella conica CCBAS932]|uniref:Uncharacterized protein n=1 Tax=Morchella conica CCBAS932 TaxID=1392247 RepID=A0A3N4KS53_9PEZI|nr:hypothetical protein P167DRAFT_604960 [Morchella conica CCBAS932]